MKLIEIVDELKELLNSIDTLKIHDFKKCPPILKEELELIEAEIGFHFPNELRDVYLQEASTIKLNWWADKTTFGVNYKSGEFYLLSPEKIKDIYKDMVYEVQQAEENSELQEDKGLQAIIEDWLHWIPIIRFSNGDAFCIDKRNLQIVFLEHDVMDAGPSVHGTMIAINFKELILKWSKLGFVDVYDWYEVCDSDGLDINREQFKSIREVCSKVK